MTEDGFRLLHIRPRLLLIGLLLVVGPAIAWSAIWVTRTYIVPSRVPVHRPMAVATPAVDTAPTGSIAAVAPSAADQPFRVAAAGNEPFLAPAAATAPPPASETAGAVALVQPVPLPRPKPRVRVAAIKGPVPLPRPRPSQPE
jgi:hypothetical protein